MHLAAGAERGRGRLDFIPNDRFLAQCFARVPEKRAGSKNTAATTTAKISKPNANRFHFPGTSPFQLGRPTSGTASIKYAYAAGMPGRLRAKLWMK